MSSGGRPRSAMAISHDICADNSEVNSPALRQRLWWHSDYDLLRIRMIRFPRFHQEISRTKSIQELDSRNIPFCSFLRWSLWVVPGLPVLDGCVVAPPHSHSCTRAGPFPPGCRCCGRRLKTVTQHMELHDTTASMQQDSACKKHVWIING